MKISSLKEKALGLVVPLLLLGAWGLGSRHELFSPQLLPSPRILWDTWWDMQTSGELFLNMKVSLLRVAAGFILGASAGFLLGTAMGSSRRVEGYLLPLFNALRQVPVVAWIPFLILILGIEESFKVVFISLGAVIPMAMKTHEGIRSVSSSYLEVGRVFEFGRWKLLRRIVLPAALPNVFTGLRLSLAESWMLVVGAELVAASAGIGNTMTVARRLFQTDVVLVSVVVIAATGFLMDRALGRLEALVVRWRSTFAPL